MIHELTGNQSVNQENSWNAVIVRELYIYCDVWSINIIVHESRFLPIKEM